MLSVSKSQASCPKSQFQRFCCLGLWLWWETIKLSAAAYRYPCYYHQLWPKFAHWRCHRYTDQRAAREKKGKCRAAWSSHQSCYCLIALLLHHLLASTLHAQKIKGWKGNHYFINQYQGKSIHMHEQKNTDLKTKTESWKDPNIVFRRNLRTWAPLASAEHPEKPNDSAWSKYPFHSLPKLP